MRRYRLHTPMPYPCPGWVSHKPQLWKTPKTYILQMLANSYAVDIYHNEAISPTNVYEQCMKVLMVSRVLKAVLLSIGICEMVYFIVAVSPGGLRKQGASLWRSSTSA